jgi:uncharacterized repeat protein (TIGR04076 family)
MSEGMDKVKITVKSIKGECSAGLKIGQEIVVDGYQIDGYICPYALNSLWPFVNALSFKGKFPWGDEDGLTLACPDAENLTVFDVRRMKE